MIITEIMYRGESLFIPSFTQPQIDEEGFELFFPPPSRLGLLKAFRSINKAIDYIRVFEGEKGVENKVKIDLDKIIIWLSNPGGYCVDERELNLFVSLIGFFINDHPELDPAIVAVPELNELANKDGRNMVHDFIEKYRVEWGLEEDMEIDGCSPAEIQAILDKPEFRNIIKELTEIFSRSLSVDS